MKPLFFALALALPVFAATEKADLTLNDGRVLKAARIISIGDEQVSIVHAGGPLTVPTAQVPLDVLARAHMELEVNQAEKKQRADDFSRKDSERRSAAAVQKEKVNAVANASGIPKLSPTNAEQRLIDLKAKFPAQKSVKVRGNTMLVPNVDVWRAFKSETQVATLQSLPIAIRKIEERLAAEEQKLQGGDKTVHATATETRAWFDHQLKPYVAQLRSLR